MAIKLTKQQRKRIQARHDQQIAQMDDNPENRGRVITQHGQHLLIRGFNGELLHANVTRNLGMICSGDLVRYEQVEEGGVIVDHVFERSSLLTRLGFGGKEKLVAANIDQVIIVIAPNPVPSPSLIDRYLLSIEKLKIPVYLLINKADLLADFPLDGLIAEFSQIGYQIVLCSVIGNDAEQNGLQAIKTLLKDKISIFVGQSGVGKSSLTNALIPDLDLKVKAISESTGLGNHTTSASTLYDLTFGGSIIDSPGVRSFEVNQLNLDVLNHGFIDLYPYLGRCKFTDCRHLQDAGCALVDAVADGKISKRRVDSYLQIKASLSS